jgi:BASS family bile acid:Na+ symporter
MQANRRTHILYLLAFLCLFISIGLLLTNLIQIAGIFLTTFFISIAFAFQSHPFLKGFSYTMSIFAAVTIAMFFPQYLKQIGDFQLKTLITPLLQVIMFGMGTTMSLKDFAGVVQMPKGVIIGIICQFSIMPFLGFSLAKLFGFEPEIAAGMVLIGCSPSGLASNVMAYLAKANVALSITLTSVATLIAPLATPFLMEKLAGQFIEIDFWKMVKDITYIVIVPIIIGLIFNKLFYGKAKWLDRLMPLVSMAGIALIITIITASGRDNLLKIGLLLVFATFLHNMFGYIIGYWAARLLGMSEKNCRTIAIEVGLQNGGLASGLAVQMGKEATVGLAPAVFGPLMNITGSSLATWWSSKPPKEDN